MGDNFITNSMPTKFTLYQSVLIILLSTLLVVGITYAWTEPSLAPPQGNVSMPLNVSSVGQSKAGGLILNTGGAATGLIVDKGNVGIGTASPGSKLHIEGTHARLQVKDPEGEIAYIEALSANDNVRIGSASNHPVAFSVNNTEYMYLTTGGNVGIKIANPSAPLHVAGVSSVWGNWSILVDPDSTGGTAPGLALGKYNGMAAIQSFSNTNFAINPVGGNVGIGMTNPSQKLDVSGVIKTQKLQLGDKWLLSGVGDVAGNDGWLRLLDKNGSDYYGGLAMGNLWVRDNSYLNGNTYTNNLFSNKIYDQNDTNYYVDPSSKSRVHQVQANFLCFGNDCKDKWSGFIPPIGALNAIAQGGISNKQCSPSAKNVFGNSYGWLSKYWLFLTALHTEGGANQCEVENQGTPDARACATVSDSRAECYYRVFVE